MVSRYQTRSGTCSYPLQELPEILEQLTDSDFREVILALCFAGTYDYGFTEEVCDIVDKLDREKGRASHRSRLPMHLFDLNHKELKTVLLMVSAQEERAYHRVLLITGRIVDTKVRWG